MTSNLHYLPTLIADPLWRASEAASTDPFLSLTWEYVGFANLVRFITLSALMDYFASSEGGDPIIEDAIKACRRPSTGSWIGLLRSLVTWAEAGQRALFLADLPSAFSQVTAQRISVPAELVDGELNIKHALSPIDVILQQRNQLAIAHGSGGLSRESVGRVLALMTEARGQLLDTMAFLTKFKLVTVTKWEQFGPSSVQELVGLSPAVGCLDLSALPENPRCLLVHTPDYRLQPLFPLFIAEIAPSSDRPLLEDNVFLYDGISGRRVVYHGVHRRQFSRAHFSRMQQLLSCKSMDIRLFTVDSLDWQALWNFSAQLARNVIDTRIQSGLFVPALYVERTEIHRSIEAFIASEVPALLLAGSTGMGKTSLLLAELHRSVSTESRRVVVYFDATEVLPAREDSDLEAALAQHLRLAMPLREALVLLDRQATQAAQSRFTLILLFDGVERHAQPARVLEAVVKFVDRQRDISCLKVLVAVRDVVLDVLKRQVELPVRLFYTQRDMRLDGEEKWNLCLEIGPFSQEELQRALQRSGHARPNAQAMADIGNGALANLLRHPLILNLYLAQQHCPPGAIDAGPMELITAFVQEHVLDPQRQGSKEKRKLVAAVVDRLVDQHQATTPLEGLSEVDPSLSHLLDAVEPNAPYVQLQADRILAESVHTRVDGQSEIRLGFAWDVLFDYFVAWRTAQRSENPLKGLLQLLQQAGEFFPLIGPLTLRIGELLAKGQRDIVVEVIPKMAPEILTQVLVRLVSERLHGGAEYLGEALVYVLRRVSQMWPTTPAEVVDRQATPWVRLTMELSLRNCANLLEALYSEIGPHVRNMHASMAYELADARRRLANYRGQRDDERNMIAEMVTLARRAQRRDLVATAYMFEAMNDVRAGDYATSATAARRAVHAFHQLGKARGEADAWTYVATAQFYAGNVSGALRSIQKAQQLATQLDDPEITANIAFAYGLLCHQLEAGPQSIRAHESAVAIYAARGDRLAEGIELVNLTDAYWASGLFDKAVALGETILERAPALGAEIDDVARICHANTLASLGEWHRANLLYEEGIRIARCIDNRWDIAYGVLYQALLAFDERGDWHADAFAEVIRTAEEIDSSYLQALALALNTLCRIISGATCNEAILKQIEHAEEIAKRTGVVGGQFYAAAARCLVHHYEGNRRAAALAARRLVHLHAVKPYIKWRPELGVLIAVRALRWALNSKATESTLSHAVAHLLTKAYGIAEPQRRQRYLQDPWINRELLDLGIAQGVAL